LILLVLILFAGSLGVWSGGQTGETEEAAGVLPAGMYNESPMLVELVASMEWEMFHYDSADRKRAS
jgi:hypothetical protein